MDSKTLESLSIEQIDALAGQLSARRQVLVDALIADRQAKERAVSDESVAMLARYGVEYVPGHAARKPRNGITKDGPACKECSGTKFYSKSGECVTCKQRASRVTKSSK